MAIRIPLVVDFNGKGLQQMRKEFAQLDGVAAKTKFALQKAFLPATALLGGLAVAGKQAVDAAIADQKAQVALAKVLETTVGATKAQVAAVEDYIDATQRAFTFTDDDLRPAFAKLARVTGSVAESQKVLSLAMDVAAGTGKDLNQVTDIFSKALGGNVRALGRMFPEVRDMIAQGATLDDVFQNLSETFGGSAAAAADTVEGRMKILQTRFGELTEEIGYMLLPIIERYLLPAFEKITSWLEDNPDKVQGFIDKIVDLGKFFAGLLPIVKDVMNGITAVVETTINFFIDMINTLVGAVDTLLGPLADFGKIDRVNFGRLGQGGGQTMPTRPPVGANEALVNRMNENIVGARLAAGSPWNLSRFAAFRPLAPGTAGPVARPRANVPGGNINVTVTSADPQAVVDALVRWSRNNGRLPNAVRVS